MASSARHFAEQPPLPDGKGRRRPAARILYGILGVACFVIAGSALLSNYERREAAGTASVAAPQAREGLGLAVDRTGVEWKVQWNPAASPLARASQAELLINDGNRTTRILLQPERIRAGNLLYSAYTGDVALKLTAFGNGRESASESLRVLSSPRGEEARNLVSSQTPAKVNEDEADRVITRPKHHSAVRASKRNRHHRRGRRSHRASVENEDPDAPAAADVSAKLDKTAQRPGIRQQVSLLGRKAARILPFRRRVAEVESPEAP